MVVRKTGEQVILVNEQDEELGFMEKLEAHRKGALHRAFSIFIFNREGRLLLQRRAESKYHSGGLWTNTCCGHPRPGESGHTAAKRRLLEEMGITCELRSQFNFTYKADVGGGLIEHEVDHVYFGSYDGLVAPDPEEASEARWMRVNDLADDLDVSPERYTTWLNVCWPRIQEHYRREQQRA
jgi:isopentenyl-diphosphate Delta-isomerase